MRCGRGAVLREPNPRGIHLALPGQHSSVFQLRSLLGLVIVALVVVPGVARAQAELDSRPTLYFFTDHHAPSTAFQVGGNLELFGRTPEFGSGFSVEALVSVDGYESWTNSSGTSFLPLLVVSPSVPYGAPYLHTFGAFEPNDLSFQGLDNSSYVRFRWRPAGWSEGEGLTLAVMPFHSDRLYLGFGFPLVDELGAIPGDIATGAELRLSRHNWYAFLAGKAFGLRGRQGEFASFLSGAGVELRDVLQLELQAAGESVQLTDSVGPNVWHWGLATRATYHRGLAIGAPTDVSRYESDPARFQELLAPEVYGDGISYSIAGELLTHVNIGQRGLSDTHAWESFAIEGRAKWGANRVDLRLQQAAAPDAFPTGTFSNFALAPNSDDADALSATLSADHHFSGTGFTPGLLGEVLRPAGTRAPTGPVGALSNWLVAGTLPFEVEAPSEGLQPIYRLAATLRCDLWKLTLLAEASVTKDENTAELAQLESFGETTVFAPAPTTLEAGVMVQGRF